MKWDYRFLDLVRLVSKWSHDPNTTCGAVIVRPDKTIASVGFNGFPRGCNDDPELYLNRELKLERIIHAELNAILNAHEPVRGYTMYSSPPCARCAAHIVQAGLARVVYRTGEFADGRWERSLDIGAQMFHEAGVIVSVIGE